MWRPLGFVVQVALTEDSQPIPQRFFLISVLCRRLEPGEILTASVSLAVGLTGSSACRVSLEALLI